MPIEAIAGCAPARAAASLLEADAIAAGGPARDEAKAYLRLDSDLEDLIVDRLLATALGHGEAFTGRLLLRREVRETVPAERAWRRLAAGPVRAIGAAEALAADGSGTPLAVGAYGVDLDASGSGWVRIVDPGAARRVRVTYTAGLAADWAGLPDPLRHGAVRLAAHLFARRDADTAGPPPAAVAALWRPWRRMRLV